MSDLISRQAALDALTNLTCYGIEEMENLCNASVADSEGWLGGILEAVHELQAIPSAETEPRWIPISEALPEEREWFGTKRFGTTISDVVYMTFENPKGERFCKHLSLQNGKLSRYDQSTIDAFYPEAKPIAWMPLPEPWRGNNG